MLIKLRCFSWFIATALLLVSCSSARLLKDDEQLLASVTLTSDTKLANPMQLRQQVKQEPNSRWFSLSKVQLGMYCLAGNGNNGMAKLLRKLGEPPVVYNHELTEQTCHSLNLAMKNQGYRHARIFADTTINKHKVDVHYHIECGAQNYIQSIKLLCDDSVMQHVVEQSMKNTKLRTGMALNVDALRSERARLVNSLRNQGYYNVNKEYVSFIVDTCDEDYAVDLTLLVAKPIGIDSLTAYQKYKIGKVEVLENLQGERKPETTTYEGLDFYYDESYLKLKPRVYSTLIAIRPDSIYSERNVTSTYSALNSLPAVSHSFINAKVNNQNQTIDYQVLAHPAKPHGLTVELEGTNTAGDLGAAALMTYTHRNLLRGAELFEIKLRGAYEAISGLEGYTNENYWEYSIESKLTIPTLSIPGFEELRYSHKATSELSLLYNAQERPEFHRKLLSAGFSYNWKRLGQEKWQHRWDVVSLNYMFMPWISSTFRNNYLEGDDPRYAVLRYSYENLFIMKMGYNFIYNSHRIGNNSTYQTNAWQVKGSFETAGNSLHLMRKVLGAEHEQDGTYKIFDIAYSQYVKFDIDFVKSFLLTDNSSIALHAALGLAIPYGNSDIIPYEKRYFSGGANSVRGWSVRELGPGSFKGKDGKIDFINQTGNLKLDLSMEYRTYLFWKFYGAAFIDAGNVWNTRNYSDQPGGTFEIENFYQQIAVAYGLGLRINLGYFILRLDGGMKAINPNIANGKEHYPILAPKFTRDFTFHFAVGLPF